MFKKGDYVVNIVNISQGVDIVYFIVKVHKKEKDIQLFDIINIKNKMVYHRVPLPDNFYLKMERTIKIPEGDI